MPTLVVMAAGIGSRYGGLKQLDTVGPGGETLLDFSVYDALEAGFDKLVFIIRRETEEQCRGLWEQRYGTRVPVKFVFQEIDALPAGFKAPPGRAKPWGTGQAVLTCKDAVREPFCVINADDFYGRAAFKLMAGFLNRADPGQAPSPYAMVAFFLENTLSEAGAVSRGVCRVDEDGTLISVTEREKIQRDFQGAIEFSSKNGESGVFQGREKVSMNFWGFTPDIFDRLEQKFADFLETNAQDPKAEFYLPFAVDECVNQGAARVTVLTSPDQWVGMTYPEDRRKVGDHLKALLDRDVYPTNLW